MSENETKYLSATALAKKYDISTKEMFVYLINQDLIEKRGDVWSLTNQGVTVGGKFVKGNAFGKYIVWPENLKLDINNEKLITVSALAKKFSVHAEDMHEILAEIGWIHMGPGGVFLMLAGQEMGGMQDEDAKKGSTIVRWPESIVDSDLLRQQVKKIGGVIKERRRKEKARVILKKQVCTANFRTDDGHFVNAEAEVAVDNWLFQQGIVHAYEKKHEGKQGITSTFYLPSQNVCIDLISSNEKKDALENHEKREKYYLEKELGFIGLHEEQALESVDVLGGLLEKIKKRK